MTELKRCIILNEGRDLNDILRDAFRKIAEMAEQTTVKKVAMIIPKVESLKDGFLINVLGQETCRQLKKGPVNLTSSGIKLEAFSSITYQKSRLIEPHVVLALYIEPRALEEIEQGRYICGVIVVPWPNDDYDNWIMTWQPEVCGTQLVPDSSSPLIDNPVVEVAMKHLSLSINKSTGLSHPLDKSEAVCLFKLLKDSGEIYDPMQVRAYAIQNGWTPNGADELFRIADGVIKGRRFQIENKVYYNRHYVEKLRQEVTDNAKDSKDT